MRRIISICCFVFAILTFHSCNTGQIQTLNERIDSLQTANDSLQKVLETSQRELDAYRYSPSKLLATIKKSYQNKLYDSVERDYLLLRKYHLETQEYIEADKIFEHVLKEQKNERKIREQEEAREKARIAREEAKEKAQRAKEEAERIAKMEPVEKTMMKYGCTQDIAECIIHHRVAIGMTKEMAKAAWGKPRKVNRTATAYGIHEQWCYNSRCYLYFDDGILTSWQN